MEKYVSFSMGRLRFIDSLGFMGTSLSALVEASKPKPRFPKMPLPFETMARSFPNTVTQWSDNGQADPVRCRLLLQKGNYPYEYMDSWAKIRRENATNPRKHSTAVSQGLASLIKSTLTHRKCGRNSKCEDSRRVP